MVDVTPQSGRGLSRRAMLRGSLLTGAGVAVASAALPGLTGVAQAATVITTAQAEGYVEVFNTQPQWWWCKTCSGLFYSANGVAAGTCPFDNGMHDPSASWMYETPCNNAAYNYDFPASGFMQYDWWWCNLCAGLFFKDNLQGSHCPGNPKSFSPNITGPHNATPSSYNYNILYDNSVWQNGSPPLQQGWLWCKNCQGMFHANSGTAAGLCPALRTPGTHQGEGSYQYQLFIGHK
jgi:hypothetical protein